MVRIVTPFSPDEKYGIKADLKVYLNQFSGTEPPGGIMEWVEVHAGISQGARWPQRVRCP